MLHTHQALLYQQYSTSEPFLLWNPGHIHLLEEGQKRNYGIFSVCKKNIYLRLLPFKHLLNSTFYTKICLTEGNAKEKLEGKAASSILDCINSANRRVSYLALERPHLHTLGILERAQWSSSSSMMKGLEHLPFQERLIKRGLFCLEKRRLRAVLLMCI